MAEKLHEVRSAVKPPQIILSKRKHGKNFLPFNLESKTDQKKGAFNPGISPYCCRLNHNKNKENVCFKYLHKPKRSVLSNRFCTT